MPTSPSNFIWYELMTEDVAAATDFYKAVVGWNADVWGDPASPYMILKAQDTGVAGIMAIPADAKANGAGPAWLGYIHAADVDKAAADLASAGGQVHREPTDIPEIGRFAVVADPHGAHFMMMTPMGDPNAPAADPNAPGQVGWRELMAADLESAFAFYAKLFGWTKREAIDMGPMGPYQLYEAADGQQGGMMKMPENIPHPYWGFYFNVEAIDAASERVKDAGGTVIFGPMEVPGGSWVINAIDPQGAMFGLVAPGR